MRKEAEYLDGNSDMNTKKIVKKLGDFFSMKRSKQKKRKAKVEQILAKLNKREKELEKLLKKKMDGRKQKQLKNEIKVLKKQKEKAKKLLR
ncbi:MAG: hypothetical protein RPU63_13650 [Candidatus Sedimenticola sp. (ex Thyasira tokunagai)]